MYVLFGILSGFHLAATLNLTN